MRGQYIKCERLQPSLPPRTPSAFSAAPDRSMSTSPRRDPSTLAPRLPPPLAPLASVASSPDAGSPLCFSACAPPVCLCFTAALPAMRATRQPSQYPLLVRAADRPRFPPDRSSLLSVTVLPRCRRPFIYIYTSYQVPGIYAAPTFVPAPQPALISKDSQPPVSSSRSPTSSSPARHIAPKRISDRCRNSPLGI